MSVRKVSVREASRRLTLLDVWLRRGVWVRKDAAIYVANDELADIVRDGILLRQLISKQMLSLTIFGSLRKKARRELLALPILRVACEFIDALHYCRNLSSYKDHILA